MRRDCVLSSAMSFIPQLLESLDRRLGELTIEIGVLEAARAALDGRSADAPSRTATRTSARTLHSPPAEHARPHGPDGDTRLGRS